MVWAALIVERGLHSHGASMQARGGCSPTARLARRWGRLRRPSLTRRGTKLRGTRNPLGSFGARVRATHVASFESTAGAPVIGSELWWHLDWLPGTGLRHASVVPGRSVASPDRRWRRSRPAANYNRELVVLSWRWDGARRLNLGQRPGRAVALPGPITVGSLRPEAA